MRAPFVASLLVAVAGCGGGGLMTGQDLAAGPDMSATADMRVPPDLSVIVDMTTPMTADFGGVMCGNMTCSGGMLCCVQVVDGGATQMCAQSCPDGGIPVMCDGPEDCDPNGNKYCCAKISVGAGNPPNCPLDSASAACANKCQTMLPMSCPGMGQVRLCHTGPDCADDPGNMNCCQYTMGGQTMTFCVNNLIKTFANKCFP